MRNFIFLLSILCGHYYSTCQSLERVEIIDSLYWGEVSKQKIDSFYFRLNPVSSSSHRIHFRVSIIGQTIDLYSDDSTNFRGVLTNYIQTSESVKNKNEDLETSYYVFNKTMLDPLSSGSLAWSIVKSGQIAISMDTINKYWERGYLHCEAFLFLEYKNQKSHSLQEFHCPHGQPEGAPFKELVLSNYREVVEMLGLDSLYQVFMDSLPRGKTYSKDGYIQMYFLTDEQIAYFEKHKDHFDYMDSIRDTLNSYLSDTLSKIFTAYFPNTEYHGRFFIIITKRGKLKKFVNNQEFYWISDWWDYYCYKRKIRKAFRRIDLDFVKPKHNYFKEISIWDGKVTVKQ